MVITKGILRNPEGDAKQNTKERLRVVKENTKQNVKGVLRVFREIQCKCKGNGKVFCGKHTGSTKGNAKGMLRVFVVKYKGKQRNC